MPEVSFTKENLLERTQLKAGWRKLRVKSVDEGPGKSDPDSTVWPVVFTVDQEGQELGTPVNHWFTEKQMGRLSEFIACFITGGIVPGKSYPLESTVGRHVMGYVEYDVKSGFNVIKDFKPAKA
jgi:hypothetical protein